MAEAAASPIQYEEGDISQRMKKMMCKKGGSHLALADPSHFVVSKVERMAALPDIWLQVEFEGVHEARSKNPMVVSGGNGCWEIAW